MAEPNRDDLRAAWRRMALRYEWQLPVDEERLLDAALAECRELGPTAVARDLARVGVWRAYGAALYSGLRERDERAAQELWRMFMRLALRAHLPRTEAEDLAQECMARVLFRLPTLHTPASLLTWCLRLFRTAARDRHDAPQPAPPSAGELDTPPDLVAGLADPHDLAAAIEQALIEQALMQHLRALLPNPLEYQMLTRLLEGDRPRDLARDLGLPLHRTRLAKSRALERLRQSPAFLALLRELAGEE